MAAGLVSSGREWPGLWSPPEAVGTSWRTFQRPDHFFSRDGSMPVRAVLELTPPPGLEVVEFRALLAARDKWKRIEVIGRLQSFLAEYREALARLRAGLMRSFLDPRRFEALDRRLGGRPLQTSHPR